MCICVNEKYTGIKTIVQHVLAAKIQDMGKRIQDLCFCLKTATPENWLILGLLAAKEGLTPTPVAWPGAALPLEDTCLNCVLRISFHCYCKLTLSAQRLSLLQLKQIDSKG